MIRALLVLLTLASPLVFVAAAYANGALQPSISEQVILDLSLIKQAPQGDPAAVQQAGELNGVVDHPFLEFSVEESETAASLFGCDCPYHINQLRQMRGQPLLQ